MAEPNCNQGRSCLLCLVVACWSLPLAAAPWVAPVSAPDAGSVWMVDGSEAPADLSVTLETVMPMTVPGLPEMESLPPVGDAPEMTPLFALEMPEDINLEPGGPTPTPGTPEPIDTSRAVPMERDFQEPSGDLPPATGDLSIRGREAAPAATQVSAQPPAAIPDRADRQSLAFEAGALQLADPAEATRSLTEIASLLMARPDHRLQLRAFATLGGGPNAAIDARQLSFQRGSAVREFLVKQGIEEHRIYIRPMGAAASDGAGLDRVDMIPVGP